MFYRILCVCLTLVSSALAMSPEEIANDPKKRAQFILAKGIKENNIEILNKASKEFNANVNDSILELHPFVFALQADSSVEVLNWLLTHGVTLNTILPGTEFTPLTLAVGQRKEAAVKFLLGREDLDINAPNAFGRNALGVAVVFYNEAVPWILQNMKANVLQLDNKGMTPWCLAIQSKVPDIATDAQGNEVLTSKVVPHNMDMIAAMLRHSQNCVNSNVLWLIDMIDGKDTKKSYRREDTFTALHVAAAMGNVELLRWLYSHNADLNAPSQTFRMTPLMAAISTRNAKTAALLVQYGANLDITDQDGWNAVIHTVAADLPDTLRLLHAKGASLDPITITRNSKETTLSPFQIAIATGKEFMACQIAELMPDCNKPITLDVQTGPEEFHHLEMAPLFLAIDAGLPRVVQALLEKKVNVGIVCPNNFNPLAHAVFVPDITDAARIAIYKALVKAGATTEGINPEIVGGIKEWEAKAFPSGL